VKSLKGPAGPPCRLLYQFVRRDDFAVPPTPPAAIVPLRRRTAPELLHPIAEGGILLCRAMGRSVTAERRWREVERPSGTPPSLRRNEPFLKVVEARGGSRSSSRAGGEKRHALTGYFRDVSPDEIPFVIHSIHFNYFPGGINTAASVPTREQSERSRPGTAGRIPGLVF
jgi:hypothetical protein